MAMPTIKNDLPSPFKRVLPDSVRVGKDHIALRLDFYTEAIVMQTFEKDGGSFRMVSAYDVAHAMANELPFGSGILPENTLWWKNDKSGPEVAIWIAPGVRRLALQTDVTKPPERFDIPLPGLIFICQPAQAPYVFAVTKRPTGPKDRVYKAPLSNVYDGGRSCAGNNHYPADVGEIPNSFLRSFFSEGGSFTGRSKKCPGNIIQLWKELDKKTEYPLDDLVFHGTVGDLMGLR
jgi:hypothetical protein